MREQLAFGSEFFQANLVLIAYASSEGSGETAHPRQNLRCSLIQAVSHEEPSDRKPDPAVKICHDGMLEDTNSLDGAHFTIPDFKNLLACCTEQSLSLCTMAEKQLSSDDPRLTSQLLSNRNSVMSSQPLSMAR